MIDGVYFITVYWLLTVPALAVFLLILHTQLHRASTPYALLQIKAIIFGASVLDVISLFLVGVTLLVGWNIAVDDESAEYCASLSCAESFVVILLVILVFIVVWLRHVLLLKDAKLPVERFVFGRRHLDENRCLKIIINGPPYWFTVPVVVSLFWAVLAVQNGKMRSDPDEFIVCITVLYVPWPTMGSIVVYVMFLWALVTVMTTKMLKQHRLRHDVKTMFIVSDTMDNRKSSSLSEKTPNNDKIQTSSQLPLFLVMSSIWIPPMQCLSMIAMFDFDAVTKATIGFMTLVYSCLIATLSLILSVFFCGSLWNNNQIIAGD